MERGISFIRGVHSGIENVPLNGLGCFKKKEPKDVT